VATKSSFVNVLGEIDKTQLGNGVLL
jgi:hypothetical protein